MSPMDLQEAREQEKYDHEHEDGDVRCQECELVFTVDLNKRTGEPAGVVTCPNCETDVSWEFV